MENRKIGQRTLDDDTLGSGGMLIQAGDYLRECGGDPGELSLCGQEKMGTTWSICKMNMLLHGIFHADIRQKDTIKNSQHMLSVLKHDGHLVKNS